MIRLHMISDDEPDAPGIVYDYYVSVIDDDRFGVLAGPYDCRHTAEAVIDDAKERAYQADDRAHWYGYGVCRAPQGTPIKPVFGRL